MRLQSRHIITAIAALLLTACSHIDEDERLIYVKPAQVNRNVLIEDFTGQRCVNCPNATDEIQRLQQEYGEDHVIAVGIHSGPLGFYTNDRFLGLKTETGEAYYNYWKVEYQPIGLIDRSGLLDYSSWSGRVREHLSQTAPVSISLTPETNGTTFSIRAEVSGVDGSTSGKLQLWLTEDDINAFQMMPDGSRNDAYIHQHVFRTAINGTWGEDISISEGEQAVATYTDQPLQTEWNADHLYVVGFVYNDNGVQQVTRVKLTTNQDQQ